MSHGKHDNMAATDAFFIQTCVVLSKEVQKMVAYVLYFNF